MTHLFEIYNELHKDGAFVFDKRLSFEMGECAAAAIVVNGVYGIFLDTEKLSTNAEESVAVAHEAGHIMTGSTHQLSSPYDLIAQHENRANKWAIRKLVPEEELDYAVRLGYREKWELAEFFNVTEEFMELAISYYKHIY